MPNSAQTRREPQKGKNGFSAQKGFTLIELLIAVAIMAIVASLALPSYRSIVEKRQVTSGAEQLSAFLSAAQTEAIKRNQEVSIVCSVDTGQCETRALGKDVVEDDDDESLRTLLFVNLKADVVAVDYESEDLQVVFDPDRAPPGSGGSATRRPAQRRPVPGPSRVCRSAREYRRKPEWNRCAAPSRHP